MCVIHRTLNQNHIELSFQTQVYNTINHWRKNQGGWGGGASAPLVQNIGVLSSPCESVIVHVYISEVCGTLGNLGVPLS